MKTNVPVGYRFTPTEEELLSFYLKNKILGLPLPCDVIRDKDMYGEEDDKNPWNVFNDEDPWKVTFVEGDYDRSFGKRIKKKNSVVYVFTTLKKHNKHSKRALRKAGCGTWAGSTGPKMIKDMYGRVIGFSKMLSFEPRKGVKTADQSHWIMHEYWLAIEGVSSNTSDCVLCKITRIDVNSGQYPICVEPLARVNRQELDSKPSCNKRKLECKSSEQNPQRKKKMMCGTHNSAEEGGGESYESTAFIMTDLADHHDKSLILIKSNNNCCGNNGLDDDSSKEDDATETVDLHSLFPECFADEYSDQDLKNLLSNFF